MTFGRSFPSFFLLRVFLFLSPLHFTLYPFFIAQWKLLVFPTNPLDPWLLVVLHLWRRRNSQISVSKPCLSCQGSNTPSPFGKEAKLNLESAGPPVIFSVCWKKRGKRSDVCYKRTDSSRSTWWHQPKQKVWSEPIKASASHYEKRVITETGRIQC